MNWRNYSYLKKGTEKQQRAWQTIKELELFSVLRPFDPALVSTVCVGLDTAESDLDVICDLTSAQVFEAVVRENYGSYPGFDFRERADECSVANFHSDAFPIEIFAAQKPVEQQYGWRHLTVMARIVNIEPDIREEVRRLKRQGLGTEAALVELLDLGNGNPFEELLKLEGADDTVIAEQCRVAGIN